MILNLITFASILHKQANVRSSHEVILTELEKYFTVRFVDYKDMQKISPDEFSILFIATGGVEQLVIRHFEQLPRPTVLLADGMQNSLAAALEISSWLRARGMKSEILHGELSEIVKRIFVMHNNFKAQRRLQQARIGVIGTPAGWLVASNADYLLAKRRWGVEYIDIPLEQVYDRYHHISDDEVGDACADLAAKALACREATPEDMLKAMRLYRALKQTVEQHQLSALTVSCFQIVEELGVTGCLALALLNDEGIVAGCEGDLQSVFTMLVCRTLTGQSAMMGNPALINTRTNELVLSHCTVGFKQTDRFILRSHFETDKSIGIQGLMPAGDITLVRCGGECLDEYYLATGRLVENTNYVNMCRTQVRLKMDAPTDYFLRNPLGNHHILLHGNCSLLLDEFFQANSCRRVE